MNPTYIIGLGGTGLKVGHAIKKICSDSNIQNFAYRFIDGDEYEKNNTEKEYQNLYNRSEFTQIGNFEPFNVLRQNSKITNDDFIAWFDNKPSLMSKIMLDGSGCNRQIGRLACSHFYDGITRDIHNDLNNLSNRTGFPIQNIDIYIISSLCGGTGGGIYIDIAAIVCNLQGTSDKIQAVLISPEVHLRFIPLGPVMTKMECNAWAFFKEIDFFMNDKQVPRKLMAEYSCKKSAYVGSTTVDFAPFSTAYIYNNINSKGEVIEFDIFFKTVAAHLFYNMPGNAINTKVDINVIEYVSPIQKTETAIGEKMKDVYENRDIKNVRPHIVGSWNDGKLEDIVEFGDNKISFAHFIIIDFEATCDEPVNPNPQEIIEFPAIAIDIKEKNVVAEFHQYVKPVKHPQLTEFCKSLTGISQSTVHAASDFKNVMSSFENWLSENNLKNFIILTCGDWDFGFIFQNNCALHGIAIPEWAKKTGNVKRIFTDSLPGTRKMGLSGMLTHMNMEFEGHPHSGIDDTRNIAKIVLEFLQKDGNFDSLTQTASVIETDKASEPEKAVNQLINQLTPNCGKEVAEQIEWKILDIAKQAPNVVFELMRSEKSNVREVSVFILWKLIEKRIDNTELFIKHLNGLSNDKDQWVRKKALRALNNIVSNPEK